MILLLSLIVALVAGVALAGHVTAQRRIDSIYGITYYEESFWRSSNSVRRVWNERMKDLGSKGLLFEIPNSRCTETIGEDGLVVDRRERRTVTWDDIHTYTRISPFKAVEEHTLRLFHNDEMHDTVADAVVLQFRTREERDALLAAVAEKPPAPFVFAALLSPRMRAMHDLLIDNNDLAEAA